MKKRTYKYGWLTLMVILAFIHLDLWYIVACIGILTGALMNMIAVFVNGGAMPVRVQPGQLTEYDWQKDCHRPMLPGDRMKILCDWIHTPFSVCSIGDVLIDLTILLFTIRTVTIIVWH